VVELPAVGPEPEALIHAALDSHRSQLASELAESREKLAELRVRLSGQGPEVSQAVIEGAADDSLGTAARELGADLLVVGTHGRTGLKWFFLGSVAQHAVRLSPVDVLVARRERTGRGGFKSVLAAIDFSPSSIRALDRALEMVAPDGRIDVVHFNPIQPMGVWSEGIAPHDVRLEQAVRADLEKRGESLLAARRKQGGPELVLHVLGEPPVPGIVHLLETRMFDLAVLGSHGRKGFRRAVLGSVAEAVVRRAPCSVLVARSQEERR
ncbi:MAG TPA: universal stress protein, partial [Kofleriaceae bacterium]